MTRLIERIFSAIDNKETDILDQLRLDHDTALRDGEKDTVQLKYVKLPEKTVEITDKENGEKTIMKKSGSCMMFKSGNSHMFSIPSYRNTYKDTISLFSSDNNDDFDTYTTKAFTLFQNIPNAFDLKDPNDIHKAQEEITKLKEKDEKIDESLLKKSRKLSDGKITDIEADRLKKDIDVLEAKKSLNQSNREGLEAQLNKKVDTFNESLAKASKDRYNLEKAQEAAKHAKDREDEQEKLEREMNGRDNLGGKTEEKMKNTSKGTFVDKNRKFSAAGYSDEREKIITLLLDLRDAKKTRYKDQILSSIDNISKKINDNKIKNLINSMVTELKKLSINDSQYDQIILDTIDNMKNDGIQKMFSDRALKAITKFYAKGRGWAAAAGMGAGALATVGGLGYLGYRMHQNNAVNNVAMAMPHTTNITNGQQLDAAVDQYAVSHGLRPANITNGQQLDAAVDQYAVNNGYRPDSDGAYKITNGQQLDNTVNQYQQQVQSGAIPSSDGTYHINNGAQMDNAVNRYMQQNNIVPQTTPNQLFQQGMDGMHKPVLTNLHGIRSREDQPVGHVGLPGPTGNDGQPIAANQPAPQLVDETDPHSAPYMLPEVTVEG